jgi:hypothetical protein
MDLQNVSIMVKKCIMVKVRVSKAAVITTYTTRLMLNMDNQCTGNKPRPLQENVADKPPYKSVARYSLTPKEGVLCFKPQKPATYLLIRFLFRTYRLK